MKFIKEGYIEVSGGKVWYKRVGKENNRPPLIVIHGGPGFPHNYLVPLEKLSDKRQVIFYDQLGCGKSDRVTDLGLWRVDRFLDELTQVVNYLKLQQYHILGQSWGAALGASFALKQPKGLISLTLADPFLSTHVWMKDAKRLIKLLPRRTQKLIARYAKDGIRTKEYQKSVSEFYGQFVRRYKRNPAPVSQSRIGKNDSIYEIMWGPEEFLITGALKNFDLSPRLPEIKIPVLLICGRYDEATPEAMDYFNKLLPKSDIKVFEKSAHFPHLTEKEEYMKTVRVFLCDTER